MKVVNVNGKAERLFDVDPYHWSLVFEDFVLDLMFSRAPVTDNWSTPIRDGEIRQLFKVGLRSVTYKGSSPRRKTVLEFAAGQKIQTFCRVRELLTLEKNDVFREQINAENVEKSEIAVTLLCHVLMEIATKLDCRLRSSPSFANFFIYACRDRMTQADMHRKHKWPVKTLRIRKKKLEEFLEKNFERPLTLEMFSNVFPLFAKAVRQQEYHARVMQKSAMVEGLQRDVEDGEEEDDSADGEDCTRDGLPDD